MSKINVAINGFGRIGRQIARLAIQDQQIKLVHINDINPSTENMAYLLKFDSQYGALNAKVSADGDQICVGDDLISVSHEISPELIPLKGVDVVVEATGVASVQDALAKMSRAVGRKLIVTHTYPDADQTIIFGCNDEKIKKSNYVFSSSICDTNAVAPFVSLLERRFGISKGFVTTLHPWLGYQNLVDGPCRSFAYPGQIIENFTLGRASTEALIPKETSCISAMRDVLPGSFEKFGSMSFRVPTPVVSTAIVNVDLNKSISETLVTQKLEEWAHGYKGIVKVESQPLISVDFKGDCHTCVIDARWLKVHGCDDRSLHAVLWYDNEYAYSSRVIDLAKKIV